MGQSQGQIRVAQRKRLGPWDGRPIGCDVRVDMGEVDSHRVVSNWDLSRVVITDMALDLGLEVKTFREARYRCSSLGCRVRVDLIGRDYE